MKIKLLLIIVIVSLMFVPKAHAQYPVSVVADPIEQLDHAQDITEWLNSLQSLNTQIQ